MRIVAGKHANRRLTSPGKKIRPTSENVRDRWLGRLAGDLRGARVLDVFAGSGALGLEALSRGAISADFVENGAEALHALKANVAGLKETSRARVFKRDAIPFVEALEAGRYDIAFVDAPYGSKKADRIIRAWAVCPFARVLGVEHARDQVLPCPELKGRTRFNGETGVTIYQTSVAHRKPSADAPDTPDGTSTGPPTGPPSGGPAQP